MTADVQKFDDDDDDDDDGGGVRQDLNGLCQLSQYRSVALPFLPARLKCPQLLHLNTAWYIL